MKSFVVFSYFLAAISTLLAVAFADPIPYVDLNTAIHDAADSLENIYANFHGTDESTAAAEAELLARNVASLIGQFDDLNDRLTEHVEFLRVSNRVKETALSDSHQEFLVPEFDRFNKAFLSMIYTGKARRKFFNDAQVIPIALGLQTLQPLTGNITDGLSKVVPKIFKEGQYVVPAAYEWHPPKTQDPEEYAEWQEDIDEWNEEQAKIDAHRKQEDDLQQKGKPHLGDHDRKLRRRQLRGSLLMTRLAELLEVYLPDA
ncbi:hypothetical protein K402DRAFT_425893 [Aulographum hederae CBS 113979]|uniref:Cell wall protein n=1 Tax=Aulographum hederae CBS 113979 TaxID=1176131 RepID=A0A6G1GJ13_9PEZI|nr:hypothetical protein K402DRAFT_425893 [Aulographum hederae CBS 113979]